MLARFGCVYFGHIWTLDRYDTATLEAVFVCHRCRRFYRTYVLSP